MLRNVEPFFILWIEAKDDVSIGLSRIEVIAFGFDADHLFLCLVDTERLADLSQVRSRSCFYIQSMDQTGLER
jgi:hypothetical protein